MTDETGPDIERLTQEMRAFSAYELAAQACQHLNNAAASIRSAHRAMHALGDPQAVPAIEEARRATDGAAAFATAIRMQYEAEYIDPSP